MKKYLLIITCLFLSSVTFATYRTIKKGIKKCENEQYAQAIELLTSVVDQGSHDVTPEEMAIARYYLSKSYYSAYKQNPSQQNVLNYLPKSMELLGNSSNLNTGGYVSDEKIKNQRNLTASSLWNEANNIWKLSYTMDGKTKTKELSKIIDLTGSMDEALRNDYNVHHLEGQAYLSLGDSLKAYNSFATATKHYNSNPEEIYQLIAYDYYQLAAIQRDVIRDGNKALNWVEEGSKQLSYEKAKMNWNKLSFEEESKIERQFYDISRNMRQLEFDIYEVFPEIQQEAIVRTEKALQSRPNNYDLLMSYARLMEHRDDLEAEKAYKQAAKVNPLDFDAHYAIGQIYMNRAREVQKVCVDECVTNGLQREIQKDTKTYYKQAIPYFEVAYAQRSCNSEVLLKLIEACDEADETERYVRYDSHVATCY